MLNRWRWTASIAHLPVFFPLSIISAEAPFIERQAYPLRADDVMRNTRCSRISSSRNRRQLEYPSCICIIRDRRRIRENAHVAASNRDRLTGPVSQPFFSRVYQNVLDYRTSLLLTMLEREDAREETKETRLVLQIRGWLKSSCGIKTAADNREKNEETETNQMITLL